MTSSLDRKVILVWRRSRLDEVVARYNTQEQARFQLESMGRDFGDIVNEDRIYKAALDQVENDIRRQARVQRLERGFLPNFMFGPQDLVVVVGQDGLVANTLKYLDGQPLIAVNPDPSRIQGALLPFAPKNITKVLKDALSGNGSIQTVTMAEAVTSDGQRLLAVNDFFIGVRGHTSARYEIEWNGKREHQSSSGVIISTGLGCSGWMRSVVMGAAGVCRAAGVDFPMERMLANATWGGSELYFYVREPFPGKADTVDIVFGQIQEGTTLKLRSDMAEKGVIFSDGMEDDNIPFSTSLSLHIKKAHTNGVLIS